MPEAHNYLKIAGHRADFTRRNSKPEDFIDDLLEETEILPSQIGAFKVAYHKNFLLHYLQQHSEIKYTLEQFWQICEECISALQQ